VRAAALILASLAVAAVSLVFPSAPTYDPWAWIVWGREIAHLDLSTVGGPSWKPLPVLFTIPFSQAGPARRQQHRGGGQQRHRARRDQREQQAGPHRPDRARVAHPLAQGSRKR
jgi:hypothetical protein